MFTLLMVACNLATLECSADVVRQIPTYKECVMVGKLFNEVYSVSSVHASSFRCDRNV